MDHEPDVAQAALQRRVARALAGTAEFKAPQTLDALVLNGIERRMKVPWWRRRVPEWPLLAQVGFAMTGIAAARGAAGEARHAEGPERCDQSAGRRPAHHPGCARRVPAICRHRGGRSARRCVVRRLALCTAAYVALFCLIVLGYRLLRAPAASR